MIYFCSCNAKYLF